MRKSLARLIAALEKELAEIDAEIDDTVRGSPAWREKRTCSSAFRASGPSPPAPSSPNCRNSAPSTASGSRPRRARPYTRQSGQWKGKASSAAAQRACAPPSSSQASVASTAQPGPEGLPPTPHRRRQTQNGRRIIAVARKLLTILNAILRETESLGYPLDSKDSR